MFASLGVVNRFEQTVDESMTYADLTAAWVAAKYDKVSAPHVRATLC